MNDPNTNSGGMGGPWQPEQLVGVILSERYRVLKVLGEGGMGSVYLGEHIALRKRVAIKVLHQELCRDQTQIDRFLQEARAASMIGHENIVDIVDFGNVPGGSVFFAMEFLEGEDLADLLDREGRLPWPRARELMLQIVRALGAAHDKGIIHRDLKPANCFLVRRSDGRDFVKLLDFGIAKVTDPESGSGSGLTRTGAVFGTAKYMAPEQAVGDPADQRTDIYAAAICLYEFLTGQVPYDGDNFMRVLSRHLTEPLTPPTSVAPDANITPAVEAIIVKALSKQANDRYQSMAEFEQALLAVGPDGHMLGGHGVGLGPAPGAPPPVEHTMWLGQGSPSPSQPPPVGPHGWDSSAPPPGKVPSAPPGGTMLMDSRAVTGPPGSRGPGGPITHPGFDSQPATRPPADHTVFATTSPQSRVKVGLLIALGGVIAIGGGGLAAWFALRGSFEDDVPVVVADADDTPPPQARDPEPPPADPPTVEPEVQLPVIPENTVEPVIEIPDDPEPEVPPEDPEPAVEPERTRDRKPQTRRRRRTPRNVDSSRLPPPPVEPEIKDALSNSDVAKGFARASATAKACAGGIPGMKIKVRATISRDGHVIDAKPLNQAGLPVASCVASAVRSKARFPKTKKALDSQDWTFKF